MVKLTKLMLTLALLVMGVTGAKWMMVMNINH